MPSALSCDYQHSVQLQVEQQLRQGTEQVEQQLKQGASRAQFDIEAVDEEAPHIEMVPRHLLPLLCLLLPIVTAFVVAEIAPWRGRGDYGSS